MKEFFCGCGFFTAYPEERMKHFSKNPDHHAVDKTRWKQIITKNA